MKKLKVLLSKISFFRIALRTSRMKKLSRLLDAGLPQQMKPSLKYLVTREFDTETASVIEHAENRRRSIASEGDKKVDIWYSPKPDSAGSNDSVSARPEPGEVLQFSMKQVAETGKKQTWGTTLYLIARGFESSIGLELGACAGISAIYLSSAPSVKKLITVEGSESLAEIARESLKSRGNVKVLNSLFDEALDSELPSLEEKIDFAYIDGHHEKTATIHYFNRLIPYLEPGSIVIFDDIYWSNDMHEAWIILSRRTEFAHAMDLGAIGVCVMKSDPGSAQVEPRYWDLQPVVGKASVGEPHGWNN